MSDEDVDPNARPSGTGCAGCEASSGWWFHLRRCAACGLVSCCDSSPSQHATAHFRASGHAIIQSFEPGERWCWNYRTEAFVRIDPLAEPTSRPVEQPSPGPAGRVPSDWEQRLNR